MQAAWNTRLTYSRISFQSAILSEGQPHQIYTAHFDSDTNQPFHLSGCITEPESPVYYPCGEFLSLERSGYNKRHTQALLRTLRDVTHSLLYPRSARALPTPAEEAERQRLCRKVSCLPSAEVQGTDEFGDWKYESCRLAAVIYTTAIAQRVPFSAAPLLASTTSLVSKLKAALERSDLSDCWGDMAGVLLWIALVGGAAAKNLPKEKAPERRYIAAISVRCAIKLAFQHRTAVLSTMRCLLKVQELCGTRASPALMLNGYAR